ncbi:MAG: FAD-dependent oxidoreductase [Nitrospirae bacterium]|nr:FAD-dependent oxidoreductase [Nitrospirota bacterium]
MKNWLDLPITRRQAVKLVGQGGLYTFILTQLSGCASFMPKGTSQFQDAYRDPLTNPEGLCFSPFDRTLGDIAPKEFGGDRPEIPHEYLLSKDRSGLKRLADSIKEVEKTRVVVIGAGIAGITAAYELRGYNPVMLEQGSRFGGNAQGQSWRGTDYSTAAAYFCGQDADSPILKFYQEIGIDKIWRTKKEEDPVLLKGRRYTNFWNGETAPEAKAQFLKLRKYFEDVNEEKEGQIYPEIPPTNEEVLQQLKQLDRMTFRKHLEEVLGSKLHPHIETALEHYCWSTFACTLDQMSAAGGMNAYAAEFGDIYVMPGGNGAIAEAALRKMTETVPLSQFRPRALVFDLQVSRQGVLVSYINHLGKAVKIQAEAAIVGCPKFVVRKILRDIEPERMQAFEHLKYNAYLVANVLVNQPYKEDEFYDYYLLGNGTVDNPNIEKATDEQGITDVIYGSYARPDITAKGRPGHTVLTLYRGFPYREGRSNLYLDNAFDKYYQQFESQIRQEILPQLKLEPSNIVDIRIARWGHPMPIQSPGLIRHGIIDSLRKPFKERVFFVQQDNWMYAAIETSIQEGLIWAKEAREKLG